MEQLLICIILGLFGLIFGSYAGATVWRLRARQLSEDKAEGHEVDARELKRLLPLTKTTTRTDRSRCLHCHHVLAWYDLLPLVSWIGLKGKCRYCHKPIGRFEPAMELGTAALFIISYLAWPVTLGFDWSLIGFGVWLIAVVMLVILLAYDQKWFILPNEVMFPLIGVAVVFAQLQLFAAPDMKQALLSLDGAIIILSGLYLLLNIVSRGRWIGFGDVKLGLALALLLADWRLAFIALFAANLIGSLMIIPGMITGKITRSTRVPFGPFLIIGAIVAMFWGAPIVDWYETFLS